MTTAPESVHLHAREEGKTKSIALETGYISVTLSLVYNVPGTLSFFQVIQISQVFFSCFFSSPEGLEMQFSLP